MVFPVVSLAASSGVVKVNLALSAVPQFTALKNGDASALKGRIHIGNEIDYLERAFDESKYGNFSRQPYLEATIPSNGTCRRNSRRPRSIRPAAASIAIAATIHMVG